MVCPTALKRDDKLPPSGRPLRQYYQVSDHCSLSYTSPKKAGCPHQPLTDKLLSSLILKFYIKIGMETGWSLKTKERKITHPVQGAGRISYELMMEKRGRTKGKERTRGPGRHKRDSNVLARMARRRGMHWCNICLSEVAGWGWGRKVQVLSGSCTRARGRVSKNFSKPQWSKGLLLSLLRTP